MCFFYVNESEDVLFLISDNAYSGSTTPGLRRYYAKIVGPYGQLTDASDLIFLVERELKMLRHQQYSWFEG
jgi:hypothetical protein